jgi:2-polyprenyl-3-methyl-5-hydroxy-6-metoxy-1,4-benzoquinol methylase
MNPEAMKPHGVALLDYYRGNLSASVTFLRDDGLQEELPASWFFRDPRLDELESAALDSCHGYTLDVGAGTGIHSLYLQQRGFRMCAIDVSYEAVTIMRDKGVIDARQLDIMSLENEKFDTVLMMGHGIGLVETIGG